MSEKGFNKFKKSNSKQNKILKEAIIAIIKESNDASIVRIYLYML